MTQEETPAAESQSAKKSPKKPRKKARAKKKSATKKKTPSKKKRQPRKSESTDSKPARIASDDLPRRLLSNAVPIAEVLRNTYANKPATWEEIAEVLQVSATDPTQKYPLWSAVAYSLIKRNDNLYSLAEVGRKIIAPEYDGEDKEGRLKAILTPTILSKFYTDYNGSPLPSGDIFLNVLENRYSIPRTRTQEARNLIVENAREVGILEQSENESVIRFSLSGPPPVPKQADGGEEPPSEESLHSAQVNGIQTESCFVITPIGKDESDERKHANAVLKHLIEPVINDTGLQVIRADKITKPGIINKQIVEQIAYSRLCIADLSFGNPNAFYEMGLRHALKLPMIQVIRKGDSIPFDVAPGRTIMIDCSDPYSIMDAFKSARQELKEHVDSVLSGSVTADDEPMNLYLPGLNVTIPPASVTAG